MQPKGVLIGVGVVALAVVVYLLFAGGGDDTPSSANSSAPAAASQAATAIAAASASQNNGTPRPPTTSTTPVGTTGTAAATSPTAGATPRGTLGPLPTPVPGAATDFTATNKAHQALRSYRITSEYVTGAGASPLRLIIEVQNPDRYHAIFPTLTPGAGPATIEVIGIGSTTYIKAGTAWAQSSSANSAPFQAGQILGPIGGFLSSTNAVRGSTTTIAGASCTMWTVTTPANQRADVCVGNDSLIRQLKYTEGSTTQTITFDMFNTNFAIVTP